MTTPLHTLFQSLGHTPDGGSNHLQRNLVPNLPQLCLQLLNVLDALHFTNFAVEVRPHIFNWIEVRALRGMILDAIRSNFIEELDGFFGGVGLGAVLDKNPIFASSFRIVIREVWRKLSSLSSRG